MEYLTLETFRQKVFDLELNEDWKFEGELPCIVDFFAEWCGPCKSLAPVLESLSVEYEGKINIYKVDVDEQHELAAAFGIRSIPTMLFCPKEGKPEMTTGALPRKALVEVIEDMLK